MKIRGLLASSLALLFSLSCPNVYGAKGSKKSNKKECLCECCGITYDKSEKIMVDSKLVDRQMHRGCCYGCSADLCKRCFKDYARLFRGNIGLVSHLSNNKCPLCYVFDNETVDEYDEECLGDDMYDTFNSLTIPDKMKRLYYKLLQRHYTAMSEKGKQPSINFAQKLYDSDPGYFDALIDKDTELDRCTFTCQYLIGKALEKNELGYCVCCLENNKVLVKFCCLNGEKHKSGQESAGVCVECFPRLRTETDNEGNSVLRCPICKSNMETGVVRPGFGEQEEN